MSQFQQTVDQLMTNIADLRRTVVITGISTVLGVAALNAAIMANMQASFESGRMVGKDVVELRAEMRETMAGFKQEMTLFREELGLWRREVREVRDRIDAWEAQQPGKGAAKSAQPPPGAASPAASGK